MNPALSTPCRPSLSGRHLMAATRLHVPDTAPLWQARATTCLHAGPARLRNRMAAGVARHRTPPRGTRRLEHLRCARSRDPSFVPLAVRGSNSPTEDTWSAQRIGILAWKAWKEVWA